MPVIYRNGQQREVSVAGMSSDEYKSWMAANPDEARKLDEVPPPAGPVPTGIWVNGAWQSTTPLQSVKNGVVL